MKSIVAERPEGWNGNTVTVRLAVWRGRILEAHMHGYHTCAAVSSASGHEELEWLFDHHPNFARYKRRADTWVSSPEVPPPFYVWHIVTAGRRIQGVYGEALLAHAQNTAQQTGGFVTTAAAPGHFYSAGAVSPFTE